MGEQSKEGEGGDRVLRCSSDDRRAAAVPALVATVTAHLLAVAPHGRCPPARRSGQPCRAAHAA